MDWIAPEILASLGLVLVAFLLGNCPCCGDPCIYFQDDYSVDNLATDYDNRSGSWAVSLDLLITTSTDALIVANTEVPTGVSAVFAETQMSFTATTATGRLVIAYVDDDNYWFAEVQAGATDGTLKLYERSGGTNTQRGSTTTIAGLQINETVTVQLCYADGELRASASVAFIDYTATITVAETQCGRSLVFPSAHIKQIIVRAADAPRAAVVRERCAAAPMRPSRPRSRLAGSQTAVVLTAPA
jgi:hypothetical protein